MNSMYLLVHVTVAIHFFTFPFSISSPDGPAVAVATANGMCQCPCPCSPTNQNTNPSPPIPPTDGDKPPVDDENEPPSDDGDDKEPPSDDKEPPSDDDDDDDDEVPPSDDDDDDDEVPPAPSENENEPPPNPPGDDNNKPPTPENGNQSPPLPNPPINNNAAPPVSPPVPGNSNQSPPLPPGDNNNPPNVPGNSNQSPPLPPGDNNNPPNVPGNSNQSPPLPPGDNSNPPNVPGNSNQSPPLPPGDNNNPPNVPGDQNVPPQSPPPAPPAPAPDTSNQSPPLPPGDNGNPPSDDNKPPNPPGDNTGPPNPPGDNNGPPLTPPAPENNNQSPPIPPSDSNNPPNPPTDNNNNNPSPPVPENGNQSPPLPPNDTNNPSPTTQISINFGGSFSKVFAFGDSFTDTGNAYSMGGLQSFVGSLISRLPGHDKLQGYRQCDGRLVVDFLCENLAMPHLPPYKQASANFSWGANFAVGGATSFSHSVFAKLIGHHLMWKGVPMDFQVQIDWFRKFKTDVACKGLSDDACKSEIENALFWIGEIGGSDYARTFRSSISKKLLIRATLHHVTNMVTALLESGSKYIVVQGLPPMGCCPLEMFLAKVTDRDPMGCSSSSNEMVQNHNLDLQARISEWQKQYPDRVIAYADYWGAYTTILSNYKQYNFEDPFKACCGAGGPLNFNMHNLCGSIGTSTCKDPSKLMHWDGIHLTEAMHKNIADLFLHKGFCKPSFADLVKKKIELKKKLLT